MKIFVGGVWPQATDEPSSTIPAAKQARPKDVFKSRFRLRSPVSKQHQGKADQLGRFPFFEGCLPNILKCCPSDQEDHRLCRQQP